MDRTFRLKARVSGLLVLFACMVWVTGCGYTNKELLPEDIHTVAVPIFENRTFYRGIEFELAEALVKQVHTRTPYKVVSPATAQTILEGTITRVEQNQLSRRRPGGVPQEVEVTITVDYVWKDLGKGGVIRDRRGFEAVGRYVPTAGIGQPFETAQHEAVERLARDIVSTMRSDW
ncbi:MAG: LPS assembly lipoprotein LptE [Phycisphaeraceae bacterium]